MPFPPMTLHSCTRLRRGASLADAHSDGSFDLNFQADVILGSNQSERVGGREVMVCSKSLFCKKGSPLNERWVTSYPLC